MRFPKSELIHVDASIMTAEVEAQQGNRLMFTPIMGNDIWEATSVLTPLALVSHAEPYTNWGEHKKNLPS